MILFVLLILLLCCVHVKFAGKGFFDDYIAPNDIQPIKGVFILLIFAGHFIRYVTIGGALNTPYFALKNVLGQMVVALFLFYSGYGVTESVRHKGVDYVRAMPVNRLLKVLLQFDIAVLLYIGLRAAMGKIFPLRTVLFSLIGLTSPGNDCWYIFAILVLYLFTFLAFWAFRDPKQEWMAHLAVTVLCLIFIWVMKRHRDGYWYNTVLAYVAGGWYSLFRGRIETLVKSSNRIWLLLTGMSAAGWYALRRSWGSLTAYELSAVVFALLILLVTAKVKLRSRVLAYCGKHLFSLYILQRLPMIALKETALAQMPYLYFAVCLAVTFGLSWLFDLGYGALWKALTRLFSRKTPQQA